GDSAVTWTSTSTALKISLPDGAYTLKENGAPAGYNVITETTFEIKDGQVVSSSSTTVTADANTNTVTAFDALKTSDVVFSMPTILLRYLQAWV
ncbi:MAG: SpaA isopeptide-forming pilin-related protein, partial [Succiniclasticum sp.]